MASKVSLGVNTQPAVVKREGSGRLLWSRQGGDSYSPDQDLIPWPYLIVREMGNWSLCQGEEEASLDAIYPASVVEGMGAR